MNVTVQIILGPLVDVNEVAGAFSDELAIAVGYACQIDPSGVRMETRKLESLANGESILVKVDLYPDLDSHIHPAVYRDLQSILHKFLTKVIDRENPRDSVALQTEVHLPTLIMRW